MYHWNSQDSKGGDTLESFLSKVAFESDLRKKLSRIEHGLIMKVYFERRKIAKVFMTHGQVFFQKWLSKENLPVRHYLNRSTRQLTTTCQSSAFTRHSSSSSSSSSNWQWVTAVMQSEQWESSEECVRNTTSVATQNNLPHNPLRAEICPERAQISALATNIQQTQINS